MQAFKALVMVELKKLYRSPMNLGVLVLMPVGLTLVMFFALGSVYNDYYPVPGMNHFEYILPGVMGMSVIYMGMMVALSLVEFRNDGLLARIETTPVSTLSFLGSQLAANMIIAVLQALLVLGIAWALGFDPHGGVVGLLWVVIFLAMLAVSAVGLGLITAAISKDSGAAGGLSMIFILPMMMFGALLAVFNQATRTIASFTLNYYVSTSLSLILHEGKVSDPALWRNFLILTGVSVGLFVIGLVLFKKSKINS